MTSDKSSSALMDIPEIRAAHIDLRVCELRVLAAQTAVAFWREQQGLRLFDCNCGAVSYEPRAN
jgi:hypothetical protein